MLDQLEKGKVPSSIRFHESFEIAYKKPNKENGQIVFDKLNEKGKEILLETEKKLVHEVFIPSKEEERKMLSLQHQEKVIDKLMEVSLIYSNYLTNSKM